MVRETSIEAYRKICDEGLLSEARFLAYDILYRYGPLTAGDVFEQSQRMKLGHTVVKGSVCARLTELRDLGVAREVGRKAWGATGHSGILWDVTGNLPHVAVQHRQSWKRRALEAERQVQLLDEQLQNVQRTLDYFNRTGQRTQPELGL